jgi:hypothetical protein
VKFRRAGAPELFRVNQRAPEREDARRLLMLEQATFEAVQLPVMAVEVPHMRTALGQWERARGNLLMPSEQNAQPLSIESARANTALIDVLGDPLDFRIRHVGAAIIAAQGADLTGRLMSTIDMSGYGALARAALTDVLRDRAPAYHHVKFGRVLGDHSYFRLLLPLSENGREVTALWSVTHYYEGLWQPPR